MMQPGIDEPRIHPTAIVEPGVSIGARTAVWDGVHLRGPSSIGHDCIVGEKTYIAYGVTVGNYVKINAHAYVCAGVTIEDRAFIGAGAIFTNDRYPRAFSDGCEGLAPSEPTAETLRTTVRTGATIGAGALVGPGVEIGCYAMVGMGAVVVHAVPPHGLVYGTPARLHGHVCICGAPLNAIGGAAIKQDGARTCARCGRRYLLPEGPMGLAVSLRD